MTTAVVVGLFVAGMFGMLVLNYDADNRGRRGSRPHENLRFIGKLLRSIATAAVVPSIVALVYLLLK